MKETRTKICVTGHRPNKLYGYDINNKDWQRLKRIFKKLLLENNCSDAMTGMALGVDTVFALAVLESKEEGHDIKLHCAIPCKNHPCKWPKESQKQYYDILAKADAIHQVSDEPYRPNLMQKRNEYMVNYADIVIAVWDGSNSGTGNCVCYAQKQKKHVIFVHPKTANSNKID